MHFGVIKNKLPWGGSGVAVVVVDKFKHPSADVHRFAHDDAVTHALNGVTLAVVGCVKQVVRGLLKLWGSGLG